jgi:hypothetical protein
MFPPDDGGVTKDHLITGLASNASIREKDARRIVSALPYSSVTMPDYSSSFSITW